MCTLNAKLHMGFYRYLMCVIDINALMILYACGLCVQVGVICLYIYYLSICKTMTLCVYVYVCLWCYGHLFGKYTRENISR